VSIIESLTRLVDPIAAREQQAEDRLRAQPTRTAAGPPPTFECRVCGYLGPDPSFCPDCLAETMRRSDKTAPVPGPAAAAEEAPPVVMPLDGTLDLHTVRPSEAPEVLAEYLEACAAAGIFEVRVVHGKGTGKLRQTVEICLGRSPLVASFRTADETAGGWGATLVSLRRDG
jgi:Smr domain